LELIQRHPKSFFHDAASFNSASSESDISPKHSEAEINPYLPAPAISPSQQQTHGSPQELVWDPRSNKQAPVGPLKRPRTQEERSITRQIRNRGGACTSCRKNRRRVRIGLSIRRLAPCCSRPFGFMAKAYPCVFISVTQITRRQVQERVSCLRIRLDQVYNAVLGDLGWRCCGRLTDTQF
jgi:hypothetical protein